MKLRDDFIKKIIDCNWFDMCGIKEEFHFPVEYINRTKEIEKNINSIKWENKCLDEIGNLTSFLFQNHKEHYNRYWNEEIREIKKTYIPVVIEKITPKLSINGFPLCVLDDIKMNLLSIIMVEIYSDYYSSEFYDEMLIIYISGHLPCGWRGNIDGKFIVY